MASRVKINRKYSFVDTADYTVPDESLTVPNDALSMRQLLMRFQRGQVPAGYERDMVGDPDGQDFVDPSLRQNSDLTDIDDYAEEFHTTLSYELAKSAHRRASRTSFASGSDAQGPGATTDENPASN